MFHNIITNIPNMAQSTSLGSDPMKKSLSPVIKKQHQNTGSRHYLLKIYSVYPYVIFLLWTKFKTSGALCIRIKTIKLMIALLTKDHFYGVWGFSMSNRGIYSKLYFFTYFYNFKNGICCMLHANWYTLLYLENWRWPSYRRRLWTRPRLGCVDQSRAPTFPV